MTVRERFISGLLRPIHTSSVWAIGLYTLVWGFWLANPFWKVFPQAQLFSTLGLVAPELFWGCFAIFCGSIILWGAFHSSIKSLRWGAWVAGFHWMMIACFYFVGDWHNTGGITSLFIAVYAAYIWLNLKVNSTHRGRQDDELLL